LGLVVSARASRSAATSLHDRLTDLRREWTEGLRVWTRHRVLRTVQLFLLITCIGEGIMGALFAPFVHSILRGSGAEYGVILSAQAIGGIGGGVLAASLGNRVGTARTLGCAAVASASWASRCSSTPWPGPPCGPASSSLPSREFPGPSSSLLR
jgi:Na+/melibiose symporter-like transporter